MVIVLGYSNSYSKHNNRALREAMKETDFIALDQKIEYLVALCQKLQTENHRLQLQDKTWRAEKTQLMEKNDLARHKVEAMIGRVRALEQES